MKIIIAFVVALLGICGQLSAETYGPEATDNTHVIVEEAFDLDVKFRKQDYSSKTIIMMLIVESKIDLAKLSIEWIYPKSYFTLDSEVDYVTVNIGSRKVLYKSFQLRPNANLTQETRLDLGVRVNAFVEDRNYFGVERAGLIVSKDFEVVYDNDEYYLRKTFDIVGVLIIVVIITFLIVILIMLIMRKKRSHLRKGYFKQKLNIFLL